MKVQVAVFVLAFFGGVRAMPKNEAKNSKALSEILADSSNEAFGCGGKLNATSGTISYKAFTPYDSNERCVWIVRASRATSYSVSFQTLGAANTVIISGLKVRGDIYHLAPQSTGSLSVPDANAFVVTFATGAANNTNQYVGFTLTYSYANDASQQNASNTSEDVVVFASPTRLLYPSNGEFYGNLDLSVFVFSPQLGTHGIWKSKEIVYVQNSVEGGCFDVLDFYAFDIIQPVSSRWRFLGRICGDVKYDFIPSSDLIMVVFSSDLSIVNAGFQLLFH